MPMRPLFFPRVTLLSAAWLCLLAALPSPALATPDFGSREWQFELQRSLALALAEEGAMAEALPYFEALENSQDWQLQYLRAASYQQIGLIDKAYAAIQIALKLKDDSPRLYLLLGSIALDAQKLDEAEQALLAVLERQAQNGQALTLLSRLYAQRQSWQKLIDLHEQHPQAGVYTSEQCLRLAQAYERLERFDDAEYYYRLNAEQEPIRLRALSALAKFYERQGQKLKANEIVKRIERLRSQNEVQRKLRQLQPSSH